MWASPAERRRALLGCLFNWFRSYNKVASKGCASGRNASRFLFISYQLLLRGSYHRKTFNSLCIQILSSRSCLFISVLNNRITINNFDKPLRLESSWQNFHDMAWLILDLGIQYFYTQSFTFHAHYWKCILSVFSASNLEINSHLKAYRTSIKESRVTLACLYRSSRRVLHGTNHI